MDQARLQAGLESLVAGSVARPRFFAVLVGVLGLNLPNGWIWANLVSDG